MKAEKGAVVNVGDFERAASTLGGAGMVLAGLQRGSIRGAIVALIGGACIYRGLTGECQVYQALGINTASSRNGVQQGIHIEKSVLVRRPRAELFQFWKRFENLPLIMSHLISVERLDPKRSRWTAIGPAKQKVTWEAIVINEKENEMIAWESDHESEIHTAGSVHFDDAGNNETFVRINLQYLPPAGKLGAIVARMLGEDPENQIEENLDQFKKAMEGSVTIKESEPAYAEAH